VGQFAKFTAANFPHIHNFLRPPNLTKYAVFVAGNRSWQINWQYFR